MKARRAWYMVYQHARQNEILCAHHDYGKVIMQALLACVKAGKLTQDEVDRALATQVEVTL